MMKSIFLIYVRIDGESRKLEALAEQVSSLFGGEVKTRLGRGAPFNDVSPKYWRSRYFSTSLEKLSDDLIKLLGLFPDEALQPFTGSVSVCLVERYRVDDVRHGYYLSMEALKAMTGSGADFDFDVAEQGGFDSEKFEPVP